MPAKKSAVTDEAITTTEATTETTVETAKIVSQAVSETIKQISDKKTKKNESEFEDHDLIPCRSVTEGVMYMSGKKSGMLYTWTGYGDVQEVEFQDLRALLFAGSSYLNLPRIIVDNDKLLELPKWKELKNLYEALFGLEDLDRVFGRKPEDLRRTLRTLPTGMRNTIITAAGDRIANGKLDSIMKIRVLDEELKTDFLQTIAK